MQKRDFVRGLGLLALTPWAARAQPEAAFPSKAITLILPYGAGGPTDQHLRVLADVAGKRLGQSIVIDNRPGANGVTAAAALTRAPADGYTLGVLPASVYREPYINRVPFDPATSFTYVSLLSDYAFGLAVRQDAPWKSWADLVADARKRPGVLNIGATGAAGTPRIVMETVMDAAGVKVNIVPFKGDADLANAILGGHIDAAPLSGIAVPHIDAGKMRYLVMLTAQRVARYPDLPTLRQAGIDAFIDSPYGIAAPHGLAPARAARISEAFREALQSPASVRVMEQLNQSMNFMAPDDYRRYALAAMVREKDRVQWMRAKGLLQ